MSYHDEAIHRVITYIHHHIDEDLSLAELARYASYSPFHFSRLFKKHVGVPPQYYISSVRLQKAKELLLHTNFTIRDIGLEVGQQSLGTFTSRFTERVGITPKQFRNMHNNTDHYVEQIKELSSVSRMLYPPSTTLAGTIEAEIPFDGIILIGLFMKPIPEGLPIVGTLLTNTGQFQLSNIPVGIYYLMATAFPWNSTSTSILVAHQTLRVRKETPLMVDGVTELESERLVLHEPRISDPPILISLPLLMRNFLERQPNTMGIANEEK